MQPLARSFVLVIAGAATVALGGTQAPLLDPLPDIPFTTTTLRLGG